MGTFSIVVLVDSKATCVHISTLDRRSSPKQKLSRSAAHHKKAFVLSAISDATSSVRMTINMKKQEVSSSSEQEGVDRISHLPESIQFHIFSFLPIEDAFRTSVLSKEWRKICASLPNLEFNEPDFEKRTLNTRVFKDFVNQILRSRSSIEKFSLVAHVDPLSVPNICEWISFVVKRNVQELRLTFTSELQEKFPSCVFGCRTLRVLELTNITLKLPSVIEFPMLKTLKLSLVAFQSDNLPNQLLSCCPLLEIFSMASCSWDEPRVVNISARNLIFLNLSIFYPTRAIKISAANLHEFRFFGIPPDISSETLSSLYDVHLLFTGFVFDSKEILDFHAHHVNKIIRGMCSVRKLRLFLSCIEYLARVQDLFSNPPPSSVSMKHLELDMCPSKNHVRVVTFLLKSYPNLESLSISVESDLLSLVSNTELPSHSQNLSTEGILRHLKTVGIFCFEGSEDELDLVRFLLENATVMEKMTISYSAQMREDLPGRMNIREKLSNFSKISPSAIIYFSE